jgi:hypothetical protein
MAALPPFPRRGVPIPKSALPPRPAMPQPFLRTPSGRRFMLYVIGLVALGGTMLKGVGSTSPRKQDGAESEPATAALSNAPRAFVSAELLHQIRRLEDFTRAPPDGAIAATMGYLDTLEGPESRPAAVEWTDLDVTQALAHPVAFRGGLVRVRGNLMGIETLDIDHPAIPEGSTYRGWILHHLGRTDTMVTWQTKNRPPDVEKPEMLEIDGVFVQAIQYEDAKGVMRKSPFIVAHAIRVPPVGKSDGFLGTLFVPIVVVLIILVLATTLFLLRRASKPARAPNFTARPPGPGR